MTTNLFANSPGNAAYLYPNMGGSAAAAQGGATNLQTAGQNLYNDVAPQFQGVTSAVSSNPYYAQAQQGAQTAAGYGSGYVAPMQFGGAAQDTGIANYSANTAPGYAGAAVGGGMAGYGAATTAGQNAYGLASGYGMQGYQQAQGQLANPALYAGLSAAPGALSTGFGNANQSYGQSQGVLGQVGGWNNNLMGAGAAALSTAFDPQQALYNQQYHQNLEQSNAINAQNGVAGSPFAAGMTSGQMQNFNIAWQNAQLQRQLQGLGAYGSAAGQATGNLNSTLATGANDYAGLSGAAVNNYTGLTANGVGNFATLLGAGQNSLNNGINTGTSALYGGVNTGTGALNNGINTGVGALTNLGGQAINANTAASNLGTAGLNTITGTSQGPSDTYLTQQQATENALQGQVTGTTGSLAPTQTGTADQLSYLSGGTAATNAAANVATASANTSKANGDMVGNIISGVTTLAGLFI